MLKLPLGVEAVSDWVWPKPEIAYEGREIEIYTGTRTFTRKLKITSATGEVKLRVTVSYQACTAEFCGPPETEEASAVLRIQESVPNARPLSTVDQEKEDFSAFAADFRAASSRAAKKENVDWTPFRERFDGHVTRYPESIYGVGPQLFN